MSTEPRNDGRAPDDLRAINIDHRLRPHRHRLRPDRGRRHARDLHRVSVDEEVPRWMAGQGKGWVTAEYGMLPASTGDRKRRDVSKGRPDGRTVEIQRLIGRSLRGVIDFKALGERTVWIDCDVLEADGGTRCAAITGGFVALRTGAEAPRSARASSTSVPLSQSVAAVSCGMVGGRALLDLDYSEDSKAEVDANVVMTGDGGLVEVQATAERTPLSRASLDELLALAAAGIERLRAAQEEAVGAAGLDGAADPPSATRRRHPQRAQAARARSDHARPQLDPAARRRRAPARDRHHVRRNALGKARAAAAATGPPGDRRRLGHRGRGPERRPGRLVGPLRRRSRHRRGEPRQAAARGPA